MSFTKSDVMSALSFRNISALYIFAIIFLIFSLWIPEKFLQAGVWRSLLDSQALVGIAALAALIPLAAGALNLAIGAQVGFCAILSAFLLGKLQLPILVQVPLVLCAGALIGLVTGIVITKLKVEPIIATLAMSSVLLAGMSWVSGSQQILGLDPAYREIAAAQFAGVTVPVWVLVVVAIVSWYVLEKTPVGRRLYAVGFNPESARLAGIHVQKLQIMSLVAGGALAALAGALLTSRLNAGDPTVGPSYLLPALTAVFLGATQFKGGRFNVAGTIVAMYVLAVGIKGLQLVGSPTWVNDLFYGVALILAVALSQWERVAGSKSVIRRLIDRVRHRLRARAAVQDSPAAL